MFCPCLLLGENVDNSEATSHANLVSKAHSVAGCRPIKNKNPTASYVSKLPTKQREFYFCMACSFREKNLLTWTYGLWYSG